MKSRNRSQFTVVYDGEAVRESRMDVRDLAPALLALGDVLEQANRVLNGDRATVSVQVKAFKDGCFGIDLEVLQSCGQSILNWFAPGTGIREAIEILSLLGLPASGLVYGLYRFIRKTKGKKAKHAHKLEDGNVRLTFEFTPGQEEEIIISADVLKLYNDVPLREAVDKSLAPLKTAGIDSFSVEHDGKREVLATTEDVEFFAPPTMDIGDLTVDETPREAVLSIVSLSFKEDNKWRLSDGSAIFHVRITDAAFLRAIDEGATFAKGDLLKVLLVSKINYTKDGLKTDYEAVSVLEHKQRPRQLSL